MSGNSAHIPFPIDVRTAIAEHAATFFSVTMHKESLEVIGETDPSRQKLPLSAMDFVKYLELRGNYGPLHPKQIEQVLSDLVIGGILVEAGTTNTPILGRCYWQLWGVTKIQSQGRLWLAKALGPEFLIPIIASATVVVVGLDPSGDQHQASGIMLDKTHVLTCGHVLDQIDVTEVVQVRSGNRPAVAKAHILTAVRDESEDVAIITLTNDLVSQPGIAFREPAWGGLLYIFGYPRIPFTAREAIVVQSGEVVNPNVETLTGSRRFIFSATARPGNSGGPVIGADGRFLGIVTEHFTTETGTVGAAVSAPFHAGIPTSKVVDALSRLGYDATGCVETWN